MEICKWMANQIVCVLAETYGLRIYAIMLPPSDFSVAAHTSDSSCATEDMMHCIII